MGKGAIVSMPFGRRRARGIVVGVEDAPTGGNRRGPGRRRRRPTAACARRPRPLACGLLRLDARQSARASSRRSSQGGERSRRRRRERQSLPGEAEPLSLSVQQRAAVARIVASARRRGRPFPALGGDRLGEDRGLPPGLRCGARAGTRGDRARPRDRPRAADGRPHARPLRRPGRDPPLGPHRRRAPGRAGAHRVRGGSDRGRRALGGLRAGRTVSA